jgi:DNA ligase-1
MLPRETEYPFDSSEHFFEPIMSGRRLIMVRRGGATTLFAGDGTECTADYPELSALRLSDVVLDGVAVRIGMENGEASLASGEGRPDVPSEGQEIQTLAPAEQTALIVFDVLWLNGTDLTPLPLQIRKEALDWLDFGNPRIAKIPFIDREGIRFFAEVQARSMEGMIAKRKDSIYVSGRRSGAWLKVANRRYRALE